MIFLIQIIELADLKQTFEPFMALESTKSCCNLDKRGCSYRRQAIVHVVVACNTITCAIQKHQSVLFKELHFKT